MTERGSPHDFRRGLLREHCFLRHHDRPRVARHSTPIASRDVVTRTWCPCGVLGNPAFVCISILPSFSHFFCSLCLASTLFHPIAMSVSSVFVCCRTSHLNNSILSFILPFLFLSLYCIFLIFHVSFFSHSRSDAYFRTLSVSLLFLPRVFRCLILFWIPKMEFCSISFFRCFFFFLYLFK